MRAAKWARNPPSARQVKRLLVIFAIVFAIFIAERLGFWPDALTLPPRLGPVYVPHNLVTLARYGTGLVQN